MAAAVSWRAPLLLAIGVLTAGCAGPSTAAPTPSIAPRRTAPSLGPTDRPPPTVRPAATDASQLPRATLAPIPPVLAGEHVRGPLDAPVTLIVYSDFQCLACARLSVVLGRLLELHPQDLRLVFRHFPLLELRDKSALAGQLAEIAAEQDQFWSMHDLLFERWPQWEGLAPSDFVAWASDQAEAIGLDGQRLQAGLKDGAYQQAMATAFAQGIAMGIPAPPFMLLDGEPYVLPAELNYLEAAVRLQLLSDRQYRDYPSFDIDLGRDYLARLRLDRGEVVLQLYPQLAPLAVNSFVFLAGEGWFDGNGFYQVQPGVFVESGDPTGTGLGDPGYHFAIEPAPSLRFDQPGMLALVPTSPGTNGGRFFITLAPLPELNGSRTILGRVVQGLELLRELPVRDPLLDLLDPPAAVLLGVDIEARP